MAEEVRIVDAFDLREELRMVLRPDEPVADADGRPRRLPRFFYEVPSHEAARQTRLAPHFGLNELILVDVKEARVLRDFPRYVPCGVRIFASYLERFREAAGSPVWIAYNGGYRS